MNCRALIGEDDVADEYIFCGRSAFNLDLSLCSAHEAIFRAGGEVVVERGRLG